MYLQILCSDHVTTAIIGQIMQFGEFKKRKRTKSFG